MTVQLCLFCQEETAHFNGTCAKCEKPKKDYCAECNISFGLAERRVALDGKKVVHEDCYTRILARFERVRVAAGLIH